MVDYDWAQLSAVVCCFVYHLLSIYFTSFLLSYFIFLYNDIIQLVQYKMKNLSQFLALILPSLFLLVLPTTLAGTLNLRLSAPGIVKVCVNKKDGKMRIVKKRQECTKKLEFFMTMNVRSGKRGQRGKTSSAQGIIQEIAVSYISSVCMLSQPVPFLSLSLTLLPLNSHIYDAVKTDHASQFHYAACCTDG